MAPNGIGSPKAIGIAAIAGSPFGFGMPGQALLKGYDCVSSELGPPGTPITDSFSQSLESFVETGIGERPARLPTTMKEYVTRGLALVMPAALEGATLVSYVKAADHAIDGNVLPALGYAGAAFGVRLAMYVSGRRMQRMFGPAKEENPPLFT